MVKVPPKTSQERLNRIVNELGQLKDQQKKLAEREAVLREKLVKSGFVSVRTKTYYMTLSRYDKLVVDYEELLKHLKVSALTMNRFSKVKKVTSVSVRKVN